ncbi:MAG: 2-C-methyl-D-erythritol 4-phosphate cytidylyltransferase [Leptospira sp.]|nr:2-C-methyl-D-erythritol 4-phosphate cytidylyltransferase [Leptospira sp.]
MNNIYGVLLSGGTGSRMKSDLPKQFLKIRNMTLLSHCLKKFQSWGLFKMVVVVAPAEYIKETEEELKDFLQPNDRIIEGGKTRHESTLCALSAIKYDENDVIIFHDSARPFLAAKELDLVSRGAVEYGSSSVASSVTDTVVIAEDGFAESILKRENVYLIKTPQAIHTGLLRQIMKAKPGGVPTDLSSWVQLIGKKTHLEKANPYNLKITAPGDLELAEKQYDLFQRIENIE